MKKILLMLSIFSLSFTGTMYMAYDFDETENMTLGYNHTFKTWTCEESGKPCWILAGGANYDLVAEDVGFASIYALPMKPVTDKMAVWASLGYASVTEGDWDGGLTYGLGLHYNLTETCGMGIGMVSHDVEYTTTVDILGMPMTFSAEDTLEKMNLFFSYKF